MADLSISLTPGYTFTALELVTIEKLNALSNPSVVLSGTINATSIADGGVTTIKLAAGVLSNDTAGHSKMADGYLSVNAEGQAKMAAGYFTADATGRAYMAAGYFTADATGLGKFANGFLTNDSAGRLKMADGFFTADDTATTGGRAKFAANIWTLAKMAAGVIVPINTWGTTRNCVVKNGGAVQKLSIDISAGEMVLVDPTGAGYRFVGTASFDVDLNVAQNINGRDTNTGIANPQWYFLWAITDGTLLKGVLSASAVASTVETNLRAHANFTGYSAKALVGFGYNNAVAPGNFVLIRIQDRQFWIVATAEAGTTAGPAVYTSLSLATLVPSITKTVQGDMGGASNVGTTKMSIAGDTSGSCAATMNVPTQAAPSINSFFSAAPYNTAISTATPAAIFWKTATVGTDYRITVTGGTW